MRTLLVVTVTIISLLVSACVSSIITPAPTPTGGISGQVVVGPMCPVIREGVPCPDKPYETEITVLNAAGKSVLVLQTDAAGRFRVPLDPGSYTLVPKNPPDQPLPRGEKQEVTVEVGRYTEVTVTYDSGIR